MGATDLTGKTIGSYQVLRKLGQGGMATVYQAHEQSLNREVALKVIAPHLAEQEEFLVRFQREAQAAARLSHPNIVPIYSIGEADGVHYYAMEYVRGRTLAEVVAEEGPTPPERAVPIFRQAAEALAAAHAAGIVHRDIKPANIMLDQTGRVRVTDFGIAQIASEKGVTRTGALIGTPEFMSPEQCIGEKPDARSDIYSLGVTFYQVLAGKTPFTAETPGHLMLQIMHGERVPIEDLAPTLGEGLRDLLTQMMASEREQRVQTAEGVVTALDALHGVAHTRKLPQRPVVANVAAAEARTMAGPAAAGAATVPTGGRRSRAGKPLAIAAALTALVLLATLVPWAMTRLDDPPRLPPPVPPSQAQEPVAVAPDETVALADDSAAAPDVAESRKAEPPAVATVVEPGPESAAPTEMAAPTEIAARTEMAEAPKPAARTEPAAGAEMAPPAAAGPVPAADTIVVDISGEYEYIDLLGAWIEQELGNRGFTVVALPQYGAVDDVARTHLVVTAKLVGARDLQFLGRYETQYTVGLTLRGVDATSGRLLAGPVAETVQYTARNLQTQLERETRKITVGFATQLRQALGR